EILLLGAGPRDDLERRVGDVVAHLVAHHDLGATADLDVVDDVLAVVRQELGQRLFGLVEVVVGVEHRIRELAGHFRLLEVSFYSGGNDITTSGPAKTPPPGEGSFGAGTAQVRRVGRAGPAH